MTKGTLTNKDKQEIYYTIPYQELKANLFHVGLEEFLSRWKDARYPEPQPETLIFFIPTEELEDPGKMVVFASFIAPDAETLQVLRWPEAA